MVEIGKTKQISLRAVFTLVFAAVMIALLGLTGCASNSAASSSTSASASASAEASSSAASDDSASDAADATDQNGDINVKLSLNSPAAQDSVTYESQVVLPEGSTVLDAFNVTDLNVTIEESAYGPFVTAINGLTNEGTVGWTYTLNGEQVQVGASEQTVEDGDEILWSYVDMTE